MPLDDARIARFQSLGVLPEPLPTFSIPLHQYVLGFSWWVLLAGVGVALFAIRIVRRLRGESEPSDAQLDPNRYGRR